jgi:hypothetical protein
MVMQILIAIDQLLNAIFGGYADETISARAWRCRNKKRRWKIARAVIDGLFYFDKDHCYLSYVSERDRAQMPPEYRPQLNSTDN